MARDTACLNCGDAQTMLGKNLCERCLAQMYEESYRGDGR